MTKKTSFIHRKHLNSWKESERKHHWFSPFFWKSSSIEKRMRKSSLFYIILQSVLELWSSLQSRGKSSEIIDVRKIVTQDKYLLIFNQIIRDINTRSKRTLITNLFMYVLEVLFEKWYSSLLYQTSRRKWTCSKAKDGQKLRIMMGWKVKFQPWMDPQNMSILP